MSSTISNVFSETARPIKAKFYMVPPWEWGTKVYINDPGHTTAMPIYGKKTFKNQSYDIETWHVASGTRALQRLLYMMTLG